MTNRGFIITLSKSRNFLDIIEFNLQWAIEYMDEEKSNNQLELGLHNSFFNHKPSVCINENLKSCNLDLKR